jgi:PEP-CTERM motif
MRTGFVLLLLVVFVTPVGAATIRDVEYFIRGPVSQATKFYGEGVYEFLLTPDYVTVYLKEPGPLYLADGTSRIAVISVFIGMYGEPYGGYPAAVLPDGFPLIAFPPGYDDAVVVPTFQADALAAAVPEPSTWLLMLAGVTTCILLHQLERRR